MAMLLEINRNGGTTIIICTHDSAMVDRMKQRVIEIEDGLISRDEKASGYKGDSADHEAYMPHASRTALYGGSTSSGISFGDDEEYSDSYDDEDYAASKAVTPVPGLVFGDSANMPVHTAIPQEELFQGDVDYSDEDEADISSLPQEIVTEEIAAQPEEPETAEVTEINIPEEETFISFGDEKPEVNEAPVIPMDIKKEETSGKYVDPDIDQDDGLLFPNEESSADTSKEDKREMKRRMREEKLAQKEAKRKEKLDKKKKVRRTDFMPGSDIDLFPEDDE